MTFMAVVERQRPFFSCLKCVLRRLRLWVDKLSTDAVEGQTGGILTGLRAVCGLHMILHTMTVCCVCLFVLNRTGQKNAEAAVIGLPRCASMGLKGAHLLRLLADVGQ